MPWRAIGHPNIGQHCPAVEICCIRYPRVVPVRLQHSLPVHAQAQQYGYTMTGDPMSTYLVRIVSRWDRINERLFQNEMG
jgi:hypothetical protein